MAGVENCGMKLEDGILATTLFRQKKFNIHLAIPKTRLYVTNNVLSLILTLICQICIREKLYRKCNGKEPYGPYLLPKKKWLML